MLDLYLLRHAKSSWKDETLDDFDRPLNKRGKKAALMMGQYFASTKIHPEMIYCSKAKRCKATLKHLLTEGFSPHQQVYLNQLYLASSDELFKIIQSTSETVRSLMIIGHNPGLETLALKLMEDKTHPDYLSIRQKFPTAAFVHIKINTDTASQSWSGLAPNSGRLYCYTTPKQLLSQDELL